MKVSNVTSKKACSIQTTCKEIAISAVLAVLGAVSNRIEVGPTAAIKIQLRKLGGTQVTRGL